MVNLVLIMAWWHGPAVVFNLLAAQWEYSYIKTGNTFVSFHKCSPRIPTDTEESEDWKQWGEFSREMVTELNSLDYT